MKRLLVLPLLMGAVSAPTGWRDDKTAATQHGEQAERQLRDKGYAAAATSQVFTAPDGSVLYVTLAARKLTTERDAVAREIVDGVLGAPKRAQLTSAKVAIAESASKLDEARKQIEATVRWSDADAGYQTHSRVIVVADAEHVISISGDCLLHATIPAADATACDQALASLDPEVAADKRVAIALAPEGTEPTRPAPSGPSMSDVPHTPVPAITVNATEPPRVVDRRPVYVGAGIVILAAVFWWNRRRRERLEKEAR